MTTGLKRLRYGTLPRPTGDGCVPFSKIRNERDETEADWTLAFITSPAWQEVMVPILHDLDGHRSPRGRHNRRRYTSHELEAVLVFQRVAGLTTYKEARRLLASDQHRYTRRMLGLTRSRGRATRGNPDRHRREGIPSEATVSRHKTRFGEATRALVYEALLQRLREQAALVFDEEASVLYMDGTLVLTHYTPPKYKRGNGELTNPGRVTAPDAGYRNNKQSPDKNCQGWTLVLLVDQRGICLGHKIIKLHEAEIDVGISILDTYAQQISPLLRRRVRVLVADGAYSGPRMRAAARAAGLVESCHPVSHADRETSRTNARKHDALRLAIQGYPNWYANGHREIHCECGGASLSRKAWLDSHGRGCTRVEGRCETCGTISITSGRWRRAKNPDRFVRCLPGEEPDYLFGNPLTFHDPMASEYGYDRVGRQEGFRGQLATRFRLIHHSRWLRNLDQVRAGVALVLSITITLGLRHRAAAGPPSAQAPPGAQLAA